MGKIYLNTLSEMSGSCIKGHKHTDAAQTAWSHHDLNNKVWVCLSCGKEFATQEALIQDSY